MIYNGLNKEKLIKNNKEVINVLSYKPYGYRIPIT